jgi:hypothetical protein
VIMYRIPHCRVVALVSLPATKRSVRTTFICSSARRKRNKSRI